MARKSVRKQPWMSSFVEYNLTKEQENALKKHAAASFSVEEVIDRLTDDGYKVVFRRGPNDRGVSCWLQPQDEASPNAKLILSTFASCARNALLKSAYVHYTLFEGKWPEFHKEEDNFFWDEVK